MGFFDKIEHAMAGSGVDVSIQVQGSNDPSGQNQTVQVTLAAKQDPKTVTEVVLSIIHRETYENFDQMTDSENEQTDSQTIFSLNYTNPVSLQPGQPVAIPFEVPISSILNNAMGGGGGGMPGGMGGKVLGGIMQSLDPMMNRQVNGAYLLHARATVEGSHLHPRAQQLLQRDGGGGGFGMSGGFGNNQGW